MKLKEVFYLLGLKPKPKKYGFVIETHELPREGRIEIAQWLVPGAYPMRPVQAIIDEFRRFLRPGDVTIDIGANTGDSSLPPALAVGPSGTVLAFEPNGYVFPVLEANARLNPDKVRIIPLPFAAMREDGRYEFHYGGPGYNNGGFHEGMSRWLHGSAFTQMVEGRNVPDLLARLYPELIPRIRFIKVDVEGFDLAVLETLESLLCARRPYLQVEMFDLKKSLSGYREHLFRFLVDHGYEVHRIEEGGRLEGEVITERNLSLWRSFDVFCIPR